MLSYSSGPTLGDLEAGVVETLAGLRASIVSGGVACVIGTGLVCLALPRFWKYDARMGQRERFGGEPPDAEAGPGEDDGHAGPRLRQEEPGSSESP